MAKVSCILRHQGVQLMLAYRWARPAIVVAGKGRGGMFLFLLFLPFHSCSSFFPVPISFISSTLSLSQGVWILRVHTVHTDVFINSWMCGKQC